MAARQRWQLCHGSGDQVLRTIPLFPLLSALKLHVRLRDEANNAATNRSWGETSAWGLVETVRTYLERRAEQTPLVVVLDDLQWADPATMMALRLLTDDIAPRNVSWVLGRHTAPGATTRGDDFYGLERVSSAVRLRLGPLCAASVEAVVADLLNAPPSAELTELVSCADGYPAALTELVSSLADARELRVEDDVVVVVERDRGDDDQPEWPHPALPEAYLVFVRRLLAGLTPQLSRLMEIAAVLGHSFAPDDIAELAGLTVSALLPTLHDALATGWLTYTEEVVCFRRDAFWQGVLQGVPAPLRAALHRQAAEMLQSRRGNNRDVAVHLAQGSRKGDERATAIVRDASREALTTSPLLAGDLARRALDLMAADDPARACAGATMVAALVRTGPLAQAVAFARKNAAAEDRCGPDSLRLTIATGLATGLMLQGEAAEAMAVLEELDAEHGGGCDAVWLLRMFGRPQMAAEMGEGERERAELGCGHLLARTRRARAEGRVQDALELSRQATASAQTASSAGWFDPPRLLLGELLVDAGRYDEARVVLDAVSRQVRDEGTRVLEGAPLLLRARLELAAGDPAEAAAVAETGFALAAASGAVRHVGTACWALASAALRRGDLPTAVHHADRLHNEVTPGSGLYGAALGVQARIAAAEGDRSATTLVLLDLCDDPQTLLEMILMDAGGAAWFVRFACRTGHRASATRIVEQADRLAARNGELGTITAAARHARGVLDRDPELLQRAGAEHRDSWAAASAAEDLAATVVAVAQDAGAAVEHLDRALAAYLAHGAARDAARVRRTLRDLGFRRRHWTHVKRAETGWDSLTETERQVSELVMTGLTNRQVATRMFLSPHTVGFHLRQIYRKLGIRSRVEIAHHRPDQDVPPRHRAQVRPS